MNSKIILFDKLINELRFLQKKSDTVKDKLVAFEKLVDDLSILKEKVYPVRCNETKEILNENSHKIIFSSFELMQHKFRENSHSNILRHIFHHKFWHNGATLLAKFIENAMNDNTLTNLILESNYEIHREFFIRAERTEDSGRIDLLIEDRKNKFVVVIENKILAEIAVKEYSEDNEITKTQLHNYSKYISMHYSGYKSCFILLSLNKEDINLENFQQIDYKNLLELLNTIDSDNNIVNDYKILLQSITNLDDNYDKEWLLDLKNKLNTNLKTKPSLNTFEIANKYFQ